MTLNAFMEKLCLSVLNELPTVVSAQREQIFTMGLGDLGLGPSDNSRGKNVLSHIITERQIHGKISRKCYR